MWKPILFVAITFFTVISYQNCSVYESEGKALLDSQGVQIYQQQKLQMACQRYFTNEFLGALFKGPFESVFHINELDEAICKIQTLTSDYQCKFSHSYSQVFQEAFKHEILEDYVRLSFSYEQIAIKENDEVIFIVKKDLPEAVGCSTTFSSTSLTEDLSVLASLAQSMLDNSVQTRP